MRLGVFGGTFDPPHIGHLIVAEDAAAALGLSRVCFIPAGEHPLKRANVEAPADVRLQMIKAATKDSALFQVDDREVHRAGPSYTVDTLALLKKEDPDAELFLLVGADILSEIPRWRNIEEIGRLARIVVMSRADVEAELTLPAGVEFKRVEVTHVAISSSEVRERIRAGRPYRYLLPDPVYRIIENHPTLYRSRGITTEPIEDD